MAQEWTCVQLLVDQLVGLSHCFNNFPAQLIPVGSRIWDLVNSSQMFFLYWASSVRPISCSLGNQAFIAFFKWHAELEIIYCPIKSKFESLIQVRSPLHIVQSKVQVLHLPFWVICLMCVNVSIMGLLLIKVGSGSLLH